MRTESPKMGGPAPDSWRALHRAVGPAPAAGAWLQPARWRTPQKAVPLSALPRRGLAVTKRRQKETPCLSARGPRER